MFLLQILLAIIIGLNIIRLFLELKKNEISLLTFSIWLVFWLGALAISLFPNLSSILARLLGIGRGADLIIYFSLILIFYFIFSFEVKARKIDQKIDQVVRALSLAEKDKKDDY